MMILTLNWLVSSLSFFNQDGKSIQCFYTPTQILDIFPSVLGIRHKTHLHENDVSNI